MPEGTRLKLRMIPDGEAGGVLATFEMDKETLGIARLLGTGAEEDALVWGHRCSGSDGGA